MADLINDKGLDAQAVAQARRYKRMMEDVQNYQFPESELRRKQLEWFMDQKFGLMVHWGLYNQMGIKESWPLADYDEWTRWQFKPGTPPSEIKEMYSQLHRGFLPMRFNPDDWAEQAYAAGFRYLCFTAKHHDGFCMWDTKTTDYKVTGSDVPWRDQKYADITKHLFDAFRRRGMGISLYYSRADFSCPYYWEEGYAEKDGAQRIPSYDPDEKPELWKKFQDFVFAQLTELVTDYGRIDCLWYDGGCDGVKLGLPEMTERLREHQPHMLGVLRGGRGVCEDIVTPELMFPKEYLPAPWEVCTVMGKPLEEYGVSEYISFGYTFDQDYMTAKEVAHMLLDVIAKGGNLALNIAPQPDGRLPGRALRELEILSQWIKHFEDAIYATRAVAPYRTEQYAYTQSKDGQTVNAFYLYEDGELRKKSYSLTVEGSVSSVTDLRSGRELAFAQDGEVLTLTLPEDMVGVEGDIADCFRIKR